MKSLLSYLTESLSNEIIELRQKISKLDKEKIFDGNYRLDNSLNKEFHQILISLNKPNASNATLIGTWKMLFSKLVVEPLVGELIGDSKCEYSSINVDRNEKWDIKYNNDILIDVKASYNSRNHNFGLPEKDANYIINYKGSDLSKRYVLFVYPEIRTWNDAIKLYKNKLEINMKMVSYSDLAEILENNEFTKYKSNILISDMFINDNKKFINFNK